MIFRFFKVIFIGYYNLIRYKLKRITPEKKKIYDSRLEICKSCNFVNKKTNLCILCHCFIEAKTKVDYLLDIEGKSIGGCPKRYW